MRFLSILALLIFAPLATCAPLSIYSDQLDSGFADFYSWAVDYNFANTSPVHAGTHSIRFKPDNYGAIRVRVPTTEVTLANYSSLTFWIYGSAPGGQKINLFLERTRAGNNPNPPTIKIGEVDDIGHYATSGSVGSGVWRLVTIDLSTVGLTFENFDILYLAADSSDNATQSAVFIDDMALNLRTGSVPNGGVVNVSVNASAVGPAINPLIFGVAYGDATRNAQIGYTVRRWGGNSTSRYNWKNDFHNTGNDYFYENIPDCQGTCTGTPPVGNSADAFITQARSGGAQPLITIPTIGWVSKIGSSKTHPFTVGFAVSEYGAQQYVDGFDTNAGNGVHTNGTPITGNLPTDSSDASTSAFEAQWIAHLQSVFGTAANGGVKFYTLDNEVMLWNSTHRDVHSIAPNDDEIWSKTVDYAGAIKQQDPNAQVTGPVTWGYCDLFWSAADDCGNHKVDWGGKYQLPFVPWFLQQVCSYQQQHGKRLVDYLDLHYYPAGDAGEDDTPAHGAGPRMRATKELYDSAWVSESWISNLGHNTPETFDTPNFFPRVQAWIGQYCPGTKLLISEYNWGADDMVSSPVAQAEALAIYARSGLDMATRWVAPDTASYAERGFQIFLNYDNAGSKVQGNSVGAASTNVDQIGAYAFHGNARTMVLLTNKDTLSHDAKVTFDAVHTSAWTLYGFDGSHTMHSLASGNIAGTSVTLTGLPPVSGNLLVIMDDNEIFKNGFD
jgi:Glycoside hydrolase family 44